MGPWGYARCSARFAQAGRSARLTSALLRVQPTVSCNILGALANPPAVLAGGKMKQMLCEYGFALMLDTRESL